jgi:signal transduction histidine kinase
MRAPVPTDEQDRLRALRDLRIREGEPEPEFDDIVRLAATICGTPESLVSIVDVDRQWFKARLGSGPSQTPRDEAFCAHAILGHSLLVVPDARVDRRFVDNPQVTREPGIRFYAGAPLVTATGHALGTLCVTDSVPRQLNLGQLRALRALARQVTALLELRRYAIGAAREAARRQEVERLQDDLIPLIRALRHPLDDLRHCVEVLRDLDFCPADLALQIGASAHARAPDLLRLLDDLLRIAEPEVAEPVPHRRPVDLNSLADWATREIRPLADAKDIRFRLDAGPAARVVADPRWLAQALGHLLFTAVKVTPYAGQVRVRVIGGPAAPTLEVHDVGSGDERARLFEHVVSTAFHSPPPDLTGVSGSSAGLVAVKAILDAHHASVAMCDGPGDGTVLHVLFPRAP